MFASLLSRRHHILQENRMEYNESLISGGFLSPTYLTLFLCIILMWGPYCQQLTGDKLKTHQVTYPLYSHSIVVGRLLVTSYTTRQRHRLDKFKWFNIRSFSFI